MIAIQSNSVKIVPLGGLGEVGKNLTLIETENSMIMVDCGCIFPDDDTPGIKKIYPDITYIKKKQDKLKAIIITHGHEDHIGALQYVLNSTNIIAPIYCSEFTWELIKVKFKGFIEKYKHVKVHPGSKKKIDENFSVEFIHMNHSIPEPLALAITTPQGIIMHTGDFKIDLDYKDNDIADIQRIAALGAKGIKLLMMDSTNSEREGWSVSERVVKNTLKQIFERHKNNRIIVSTFASNVYRLSTIIQLSINQGRKIALIGRSIDKMIEAARAAKIFNYNEKFFIDADEIDDYEPHQITIICTGAQGEPNAALKRIVDNKHAFISIKPSDVVILSSHPIPGNEKDVNTMIDQLYDKRTIIYFYKNADIHASGHAYQEEQKLILALAQPEFFMPVHGETMHLKAARKTAMQLGIDGKNIIITKNGFPIYITDDGWKRGSEIDHGEVFSDGEYESELHPTVIKDRQVLMSDGVVVVSAAVKHDTKELVSPVSINSRGFIYMNDSTELIQSMISMSQNIIESMLASDMSISELKVQASKKINRKIFQATGKMPMVLIMLDFVN